MLWTPGNDFQFSVDNFGATYTDAGIGTNVPGHANANTKGANTALLAGIAEDCYGIAIGFANGNTAAAIRRQMVDLLIDPAAGVGNAGSAWSVAIANLYANSPSFVGGTAVGSFGYWYYFPLYLKAGTAIGAAHQDLVATTQALRVLVRVYGKPSRPALLRVGNKVQTIGATVATTTGVAVTPGTNAMGAYSATMGTTSFDAWWWQLGIGSADTTMTANNYLFDLAANATNKVLLLEGMPYIVVGANEQASKSAFGISLPIRNLAAGQDIYVRAAAGAAPDTSMTAVAYALGG